MVSKEKWINNFTTRSYSSQLEILEALVSEIENNYKCEKKDYYNYERLNYIRDFFKVIISDLDSKIDLEKCKDLLVNYNQLSDESKDKALLEISDILIKYGDIDEENENIKTCMMEGHEYTKWEMHSCIESVPVWDAGIAGYVDVENKQWSRTCKRCGKKEIVDKEPEELVHERKEKEKNEEIKRLEKRLNELKNN